MYLIPYDGPECLLSFRRLYTNFLCIFLCGTPILVNSDNSFTKKAPEFHKSFKSKILITKLMKQYTMNT